MKRSTFLKPVLPILCLGAITACKHVRTTYVSPIPVVEPYYMPGEVLVWTALTSEHQDFAVIVPKGFCSPGKNPETTIKDIGGGKEELDGKLGASRSCTIAAQTYSGTEKEKLLWYSIRWKSGQKHDLPPEHLMFHVGSCPLCKVDEPGGGSDTSPVSSADLSHAARPVPPDYHEAVICAASGNLISPDESLALANGQTIVWTNRSGPVTIAFTDSPSPCPGAGSAAACTVGGDVNKSYAYTATVVHEGNSCAATGKLIIQPDSAPTKNP